MQLQKRPVAAPVTQWYGKAKSLTLRLKYYWAYGGVHPGIDFGCPVATPVLHVVNKGRVIAIGNAKDGYGLKVVVRCEWDATHTKDIGVWYCHLTRVSSALAVGRLVTLGQVIGYSGGAKGDPNAGSSTGAHLHFAYYDKTLAGVGKDHFIDPAPYFKAGGVKL